MWPSGRKGESIRLCILLSNSVKAMQQNISKIQLTTANGYCSMHDGNHRRRSREGPQVRTLTIIRL